MTEASPKISIVVPTYNQSGMLQRLLESFESLEQPELLEVIIVDDCSPDDTQAVAERWCAKDLPFPARYLRQEKNAGPGSARNRGTEAARGEIIAFTDTDCVVTPSWPHRLAARLDPAQGIVGVGGRVLPLCNDNWVARYAALHRVLEPPRVKTPFLVTCNCCYVREELLSVGGFSRDIPRPGGEDIEASILLWKKGKRFKYAENALVYHDFRSSIRAYGRTWYNYGLGCSIVVHRQLSPQEIYPEWGRLDVDNYWYCYNMRPNFTGVRSFIRQSTWFTQHALQQGKGVKWAAMIMWVWFVCNANYLRGWHEGFRQVLPQIGKTKAYFKQADDSRACKEIRPAT